jgi:putative nucleotidyltransferase with HDIG domain
MTLENNGLEQEIERLTRQGITLPALPRIGAELLECLRAPAEEIDIKRLTALVESDPPLAARILRLANSPYFRVQREVTQIGQALMVVGLTDAIPILYAHTLRGMFTRTPHLPGFSIEIVWRHSIAVGTAARLFCRLEPRLEAVPGELYVAGLLHDVGKIVLAIHLTEEFKACVALAKRENLPLFEAERRTLGLDHARLGARLLNNWELPESILNAVAGHHDPEAVEPAWRLGAGVVQLAQTIVGETGIESDADRPVGTHPLPIHDTWICRTQPDSSPFNGEGAAQIMDQVRNEMLRRMRAVNPPGENEPLEHRAAMTPPLAAASPSTTRADGADGDGKPSLFQRSGVPFK